MCHMYVICMLFIGGPPHAIDVTYPHDNKCMCIPSTSHCWSSYS